MHTHLHSSCNLPGTRSRTRVHAQNRAHFCPRARTRTHAGTRTSNTLGARSEGSYIDNYFDCHSYVRSIQRPTP